MNDLEKFILTMTQLKESTSNINNKCTEILTILSNPFLIAMCPDKIDKLTKGIQIDLAILSNFIDAFNESNNNGGKK